MCRRPALQQQQKLLLNFC
uniref:Uncharacterized protein n=1 Tax=Rhizophora mucronata TaxID=61149 RepID=A0A2P2MCJ9_RHIMU